MSKVCGVVDSKADIFRRVLFGLEDQGRGGVEAIDHSGFGCKEFAEGALPASEVQVASVLFRSEQTHGAREDQVALEVAAFLAHVAGIPAGDGFPA